MLTLRSTITAALVLSLAGNALAATQGQPDLLDKATRYFSKKSSKAARLDNTQVVLVSNASTARLQADAISYCQALGKSPVVPKVERREATSGDTQIVLAGGVFCPGLFDANIVTAVQPSTQIGDRVVKNLSQNMLQLQISTDAAAEAIFSAYYNKNFAGRK